MLELKKLDLVYSIFFSIYFQFQDLGLGFNMTLHVTATNGHMM